MSPCLSRHCHPGVVSAPFTRSMKGASKPRQPDRFLLKTRRPAVGAGFLNHVSHLMRVAMIGTGYVGLVSGACFADFGPQSSCVNEGPPGIAVVMAGADHQLYELRDLAIANMRRLARDLDYSGCRRQ